jgi:hypothetical protein
MSFPNENQRNFFHVSRHAECIAISDRDVMAFIPEMLTSNATVGMELRRYDEAETVQWASSPLESLEKTERVLMWARADFSGLVSGYRWVPYIDGDSPDTAAIKPLREVFAPRLTYDKTSNCIHLWFWTNVNKDYDGTVYDEDYIYPIGIQGYSDAKMECKRVLCHAKGSLGHWKVDGGFISGFQGIQYDAVGTQGNYQFTDNQYDIVPLFDRPVIITNFEVGDDEDEDLPGVITDGWYEGFDYRKIAFGYSLAGATCTIYPGDIRLHGLAEYPLDEANEVTLTGSTEWVYVEIARGAVTGTAPTIGHSSTKPASNTTTLRLPLYLFTLTGGTYELSRICRLGDVDFDTPLM